MEGIFLWCCCCSYIKKQIMKKIAWVCYIESFRRAHERTVEVYYIFIFMLYKFGNCLWKNKQEFSLIALQKVFAIRKHYGSITQIPQRIPILTKFITGKDKNESPESKKWMQYYKRLWIGFVLLCPDPSYHNFVWRPLCLPSWPTSFGMELPLPLGSRARALTQA